MPNRFTAVPQGQVPPAGRGMGPVVTVADLFMAMMLSRPGGLSLRTSWVTPGTLLLTAMYTPLSFALAVLLIIRGGWLSIAAAAVLVVLGVGSGAVAIVGLAQRR